jgi:hypothetical protein
MPDLGSVIVELVFFMLPSLWRFLFPRRDENRRGARIRTTEWSLGFFRRQTIEIERYEDRE